MDRAVMGLDDGVDHGEAEAIAIGFRRDEGVEDFWEEFLRDSVSGIGDQQFEMAIINVRRNGKGTIAWFFS